MGTQCLLPELRRRWGCRLVAEHSRNYVPIRPGSVIERVLVAHFCVTFAVSESLAGRKFGESRNTRTVDARSFVQRIWGSNPDAPTRFAHRQLLHAQLLGAFFVGGIVAAALIGVGHSLGSAHVIGLGRTVLLLSCIPLGTHGPIAVRTMAMEWDARRWAAAGKPVDWLPSGRSQLRSSDLVWGAVLVCFWSWFFIALSR